MTKFIIKECNTHGSTEFVLEGRGYYRCKKCRSASVTKRRRQQKIELVAYKGGKCEKCGFAGHASCFDFHHPDPTVKEFQLSSRNIKSLERAKLEVDKCELLCSNCHRIEHWESHSVMQH